MLHPSMRSLCCHTRKVQLYLLTREPWKQVTEEQAEIDRYCNYQPSKLKDGRPHPDIIVESASLATTAAPDISADYSSLKARSTKKLKN